MCFSDSEEENTHSSQCWTGQPTAPGTPRNTSLADCLWAHKETPEFGHCQTAEAQQVTVTAALSPPRFFWSAWLIERSWHILESWLFLISTLSGYIGRQNPALFAKANECIRRQKHEQNLPFESKFKWGTVVHTCNLCTQEAGEEVVGSRPIQATWQDLVNNETKKVNLNSHRSVKAIQISNLKI